MIALTIDCEEWNSPALRGRSDLDNGNTTFSRLGNEQLLKLFQKHGIHCTFFVTGYFAEREPESVKEIIAHGHEIASHGYEHHYRKRVFDVENDVRKSKEILEKITGKKVIGFRAPQVQYSLELLQALKKHGFRYDSSLHPAFLPGYYPFRNVTFPLTIHEPIPGIKEIPIGTIPAIRLPIVWVFMRNLGNWYTQLGINGLSRRNITPNIYIHSWECTSLTSRTVPWYFTRRTGQPFLEQLERFIVKNKEKGFCRLDKFLE